MGEPVLRVRDLTIDGWCEDISFEVRAAEFVGLAGLAGCGKAQVADAIAGLSVPEDGDILIADEPICRGPRRPGDRSGHRFVPGDRHARGFCSNLSTEENLTMTVLDRLGRFGLVDHHSGRTTPSA